MPASVSILGLGLRLPGASGVDAFWRNLEDSVCSVAELGSDRFSPLRFWHPQAPMSGKSYARAAGLLPDLWGFDAAFFGVSPREAAQLDPQQRLLLQVGWEAIEEAGLALDAAPSRRVGVYVGGSSLDFANYAALDPDFPDAHFMTGSTLSILSNRVSSVFGFQGPSLTVDTACSSSLHALAQAVAALKAEALDYALVCGVNALISPFPFIGFSQARMLSPTGRCRAFGAGPDGYVRGEGAVALMLARPGLREDRAIARIRAVALSSDGRKRGISVPSVAGQVAALEAALAEAEVAPETVAFVEAHGTGTAVGDPIEAEALGAALGRRRSAPLPIGSVKSNIGHLEPASGLAGLAKAVLALRHGRLPATLFAEETNPDIDFEALNLQVAQASTPLPGKGARIAGVNSFGFGGTNAHVVIEAAEAGEEAPAPAARPAPLVISAQSEAALRSLAEAYAARCEAIETAPALAGLAAAAAHRRTPLSHRLAISATEPAAAAAALRRFAETGEASGEAAAGQARAFEAGRPIAFAFSGNGAQWPGMGRAELAADPAFAARFDAVDAALAPRTGWSARAMIESAAPPERLAETSVAQPLLFALQAALSDHLIALGLRPTAMFGHSVGEIAAAYAAGALPLDAACALVVARSTLQEEARGIGGMAVLGLGAEDAAAALAREGFGDIDLACVNSARNVTLAGPQDRLAAFAALARRRGWVCKRLDLDYPFHSRLLDPLAERFLGQKTQIETRPAERLFISSVAGGPLEASALDLGYWWRNLRDPVRFADAVDAAIATGVETMLEIGPKPILLSYLRDGFSRNGVAGVALPSFSDRESDGPAFPRIMAQALANGAACDRGAVFGPDPEGRAALPGVAWRNEPHREAVDQAAASLTALHPLLGWPALAESDAAIFECDLDPLTHPFLADHQVAGRILFPGAGFVETALAAGREAFDGAAPELRDFQIVSALRLEPGRPMRLRARVSADRRGMRLESRPLSAPEEGWSLHARGRLAPPTGEPLRDAPAQGETLRLWEHEALYRLAESRSLSYGPGFALADRLEKRAHDLFRVTLAAERAPSGASVCAEVGLAPFGAHPSCLDAALHGLFAAMDEPEWESHPSWPYVPVLAERVALHAPGAVPAAAMIRVRRSSVHAAVIDLELLDATDAPIMTLEGFRLRASAFRREEDPTELCWVERAISDRRQPPAPLPTALEERLRAELEALDAPAPETDAAGIEARLLLETGAIAAAIGLAASETATSDTASSEAGSPAAARRRAGLLAALEAAALVRIEAREDGLPAAVPIEEPPFLDGLIAAAVAAAPDCAASAALLSRAAEGAAEGAAEDPAAPEGLLDQHLTSGPLARRRAASAERLLAAALSAWPAERALRLGVIGLRETSALDRLLEPAAPALRLTVLCENERLLAAALAKGRGEARLEALRLEDAPEGAFDLLADFGQALRPPAPERVMRLLAAEGALLAAAPPPGFLADLVFGLREDWFEGVAAAPVGPLLTGAELRERFARMRDVEARTVDLGEAGTALVALRRGKIEAGAAAEPAAFSLLGGALGEAVPAWVESVSKTEAPGAWPLYVFGDRALVSPSEALAEFGALLAARAAAAEEERVAALIPAASDAPDYGPLLAALRALARTVGNEQAGLRVEVLAADGPEALRGAAAAASQAAADGERLAPGAGRPSVARLAPPAPRRERSAPGERRVLTLGRRGRLDSLHWRAAPRRAPGPGEIEIKIAASGLNFRDVMWAMNLLPEEALESGYSGPTLGFEGAGEVVAVGEGVADRAVGDRVAAFGAEMFASHVTLPAAATARLPKGFDPAAAASAPVAYLTAHYALVELARLQAGETVLIHGAAGGVGLAALAIAKEIGARTIATSGSAEKRALLRRLGAEVTASSRDGGFVAETRAATGGEGVDVVLNSLAGAAMEQSLALLKPFGRFCELGKRDFYEDSDLALRAFRRNLSYFGIDVDQLLARGEAVRREAFETLERGFRDGRIAALPLRVLPAEAAEDAFRLMQRSEHVGKIVIAPPAPETALPSPVAAEAARWRFDPEAAHLIIGGTGGFGLATARWMAARGARKLCLMSRRGAVSEEARAAIAALRAMGAEVVEARGDAAAKADLAAALAAARAMGPLRSAIHAAMTLDDRLLAAQDRESFAAALRPKIDAAELLDRLTREDPIERFILFSSATTQFGNPGQANYVAANGYLEGLARRRRAEGLPALAPAWGAIGDVGVLARDQAAGAMLRRRLGEATVAAEEALDALEAYAACCDDGSPEAAAPMIGRFDWRRARKELPEVRTAAFDAALAAHGDGAEEGEGEDLRARLAGLDEAAALAEVGAVLQRELARVLRLTASDVPLNRPMMALGLDSLMAMELRAILHERYGVEIPISALSQNVTLAGLAEQILQRLSLRPDGAEEPSDLVRRHLLDQEDDARLQEAQQIAAQRAAE